jgi:alpha-L-fucosidase 2
LLDGDHAYKLITDQLTPSIRPGMKEKGGTYSNLFDAHPPFQIDGNFGCAAGIAEMLMQSYDASIYVLPALPDRWKDGEVKGLVARGGFELDLMWKDGKIDKLRIYSRLGGNCRIRLLQPVKATDGAKLQIAKGENSNQLYAVNNVMEPVISPEAKLEKLKLKKTYLYDFQTEPGKAYTFEISR